MYYFVLFFFMISVKFLFFIRFKVKDGNKQQFITTIKSLAEEGKNNQLIFVILPDCKMIQSKIKRTLLSVCGNGKGNYIYKLFL